MIIISVNVVVNDKLDISYAYGVNNIFLTGDNSETDSGLKERSRFLRNAFILRMCSLISKPLFHIFCWRQSQYFTDVNLMH